MLYGECPVCYNTMELSLLVCGHAFCRGCIHQWHSKCQTCPCCKQPTLMECQNFELDDHVTIVDLSIGTPIGVVVRQHKSGNLCITSIKKAAQFYKSGCKRGTIVEELNGLKYDPQSFVNALQFAKEKEQVVYLTMQKCRFNKGHLLWRGVLETFRKNMQV